MGPEGDIGNSAVAKGCTILGEVKNTVLSYGSSVAEGAQVSYSVVMPNAVIEDGSQWCPMPSWARAAMSGKNAVVGGTPGSVDFDRWGIAGAGTPHRRPRRRRGGAENDAGSQRQGGTAMKGMHGIIFSYEKRTDLRELIADRIHGSIPFAGDYRVIDFVLSAMVNAGVTDVGVIMHGKCQSMLDHLGSGKSWDLSRNHGGLTLLPAFAYNEKRGAGGQYRGKVEALAGVMNYLKGIRQDYVLLSDSDLVINLPLEDVLRRHIDSGADMTAVCTTVAGRRVGHLLHGERFRPHHRHRL